MLERKRKILSVFNMVTRMNELKTLAKHIRIESGMTINVNVSVKIQKNIIFGKKMIFEILLHVVAEMVNI